MVAPGPRVACERPSTGSEISHGVAGAGNLMCAVLAGMSRRLPDGSVASNEDLTVRSSRGTP
jgi:hypothetical protein